jgi:hypothetical protein
MDQVRERVSTGDLAILREMQQELAISQARFEGAISFLYRTYKLEASDQIDLETGMIQRARKELPPNEAPE